MRRIIGLALLIVFLYCNSYGKAFTTKGVEGALGVNLTFQYPDSWTPLNMSSPNVVVTFGKQAYNNK